MYKKRKLLESQNQLKNVLVSIRIVSREDNNIGTTSPSSENSMLNERSKIFCKPQKKTHLHAPLHLIILPFRILLPNLNLPVIPLLLFILDVRAAAAAAKEATVLEI